MKIEGKYPNINKNSLKDALLKKLKVSFKKVQVGFFVGKKYPKGTDVSSVARFHDLGTKRAPQREFMAPAGRKVANKLINKASRDIAKGEDENKVLGVAAIGFQGAIQKEITSIREPELNKKTIERKGSSKPLIDTGLMRASVTWKLGKNK